MAKTTFNDFNLPADAYAAFDATSLKDLIIARLNDKQIFTDQNYEGSNLSSVIDIIAYAYHVLLFYLNRTGAESTFTTAELYENINKIVSLIGYSPVGFQTAILPFRAAAYSTLPKDTYTIPRYSYFTVNGTYYSFNKDITFLKTTEQFEELTSLQEQNLLYQGIYKEHPIYTAKGEPFETITLTVVGVDEENTAIDHFNVDVYVKDNTEESPVWVKWESTQSLFLERATATTYEKRLNENLRYEIKFGNGIAGKQLNEGDEVAIYYLNTSKNQGEVGVGTLNGNRLFLYSTPRFSGIQNDTTPPNIRLLTAGNAANLEFSNINPSTSFVDIESVDSIKENATNTFKSQFRLITTSDFENFIAKNYSNLLASTKVVNNWSYLSGHLKYYFDLGVTKPNIASRVLFNQVKFADTSNSNNVYIYAVPKLEKLNSLSSRTNYLNIAQKQLIINDLQQVKLTTSEIVINDPVYVAVDLGVKVFNTEEVKPEISQTTRLVITRDVTAKKNTETIKSEIANFFIDYFSTTGDNLGSLIKITELTNSILNIAGVDDVNTVRTDINGNEISIPGVSLVVYNPVYAYDDIEILTQDTQLPYFKFPYLHDATTFIDKIDVITPSIRLLEQEY